MAIRLSKAFGRSPESWLQLQLQYDLWQAQQRSDTIKVTFLDAAPVLNNRARSASGFRVQPSVIAVLAGLTRPHAFLRLAHRRPNSDSPDPTASKPSAGKLSAFRYSPGRAYSLMPEYRRN